LIALLVLLAAPASGQGGPRNYSKDELPEYCDYTRDGRFPIPGRKEHYQRLFGASWSHLHHYCRGLYQMNSVFKTLDDDFLNLRIEQVISEFNYVLRNAEPDFPLRPEIMLNKGRMFQLKGMPIEAEQAFTEALTLRPDYVPAYVALSNHYRAAGDIQAARAVLEAGLKNAPNSRLLARKLGQLDNKKPIR
jgi:tetratricopeptide (TPR) repeat protein